MNATIPTPGAPGEKFNHRWRNSGDFAVGAVDGPSDRYTKVSGQKPPLLSRPRPPERRVCAASRCAAAGGAPRPHLSRPGPRRRMTAPDVFPEEASVQGSGHTGSYLDPVYAGTGSGRYCTKKLALFFCMSCRACFKGDRTWRQAALY